MDGASFIPSEVMEIKISGGETDGLAGWKALVCNADSGRMRTCNDPRLIAQSIHNCHLTILHNHLLIFRSFVQFSCLIQ